MITDLIGFKNESNYLFSKIINNKLHNSIIFHGPKGVGKRIFIDNLILNFFKKIDNENITTHSNLLNSKSHPNIKILERVLDNKTKKIKSKISIDQVRSIKRFINETNIVKNSKKFILVDTADDLNINSSNSLLKNIEEPRKDTYFFLISHQLSLLSPTLRSRCLKIKFKNHNYEDFKEIISNYNNSFDEEGINFLYDLSFGSPGISLSLYDDHIYNLFNLTLNSLCSDKMNESSIELSDNISSFDDEKFKNYLFVLKTILIILYKIKLKSYNASHYHSEKFKKIEHLSENISKKNIVDRIDYLVKNESDLYIYNLNKKIFMLNFLNT